MKRKPDITLIFPSSPFLLSETMFPPLGIMYLSAFLKMCGFKVQCLDMSLPEHNKEMAEADIIGLSFSTPQRDEAFKLAKYFKNQGRTIIGGGPHPSHMPDECYANGFDRVVAGPGEIKLLLLMAEYLGRDFYSQDEWPIDALPYPDRECLPIHEYKQEIAGRPATAMIASRGCPYRCSFCANIEQPFRVQSADRTLSEIYSIRDHYGYTAFSIYDDTFAIDKKRLAILADTLENQDFKFRCFCRANLLTEEVCRDFARMGCVGIGVGIESGSNEILKANMKGTSRLENTTAIGNLKSYGIEAKAFLIVGLPGETEETVKETASWIEEAGPDDIGVSVFQPLPGSPIFKNPQKWGVDFSYDGQPMWYRGKPGEYKPTVRTEALSTERIAYLRDWLENTYKNPEMLK